MECAQALNNRSGCKGTKGMIKPNSGSFKKDQIPLNRKLSFYDAQAIRFYKMELGITSMELSKLFKVCQRTISRIIANKSYKNNN